jgi:hypothetical protein
VRVYVNGRGVDAVAGSSALDAVRIWDALVADQITGGARALTDSRGLPIDHTTPVFGGLILRVVSHRVARPTEDA